MSRLRRHSRLGEGEPSRRQVAVRPAVPAGAPLPHTKRHCCPIGHPESLHKKHTRKIGSAGRGSGSAVMGGGRKRTWNYVEPFPPAQLRASLMTGATPCVEHRRRGGPSTGFTGLNRRVSRFRVLDESATNDAPAERSALRAPSRPTVVSWRLCVRVWRRVLRPLRSALARRVRNNASTSRRAPYCAAALITAVGSPTALLSVMR